MKLEQPRSLHEGTDWPTIMYKLSWMALIISVLPSSTAYMYIRSDSELILPCVHLKEGDGVSLVRCAVEFTGKAMVPYTYSFVLQSKKCWICRTADNPALIFEEVEIVQHFYQIGMCCHDYVVDLMPSRCCQSLFYAYIYIQYITRNMHTVLLCFALLWLCNRS